MSLLGLDIGSGSCKGVVFDYNGKELARTSSVYTAIANSPIVEINPKLFRDAVFHVIRALTDKVKSDPIKSIAISSHGETTIPVDDAGNPVGPAIMNADNRAVEESDWWDKTFGKEKIYAITGVPLHPMFSLNKILWLKKHQPELYNKADKFLSVGDFILVQLGLPAFTDYSLACRTMAFDINKCEWSDEILDHCRVPKNKLPVAVPSGTIAGKLSAEIALQLNLEEGVTVALGGHDQPCGALGAGAVDNYDVFDSAGTYECMVAVTDAPANNSKALNYNLNSYCHVVPGKYVTLAFFPAGVSSTWFVEQFCYEEKMIAEKESRSIYEILSERVSSFCMGPSGINITPHFVGSCNPHWDVKASGVMAGITPAATKYHIYKAIFEGIACELAINAEALEDVLGKFQSMNIAGGNARSSFTVQLRADLTGKIINVLESDEAVCLGAAILAGIAAGIYKDAADAAKKVVRVKSSVHPDSVTQETYNKQFERYKVMYSSLAPYREI